MLTKACQTLLLAVKFYGLSATMNDAILGLFTEIQVDHTTLVYTLFIEGLFVLFKTAQVEVPAWAEILQDLF